MLVIRTLMNRSQENTSQKGVQIRLRRLRPGALSQASQLPFRPKNAVSMRMNIGVPVIAKVTLSHSVDVTSRPFNRWESLEAIKAKTRCLSCGQRGHWRGECATRLHEQIDALVRDTGAPEALGPSAATDPSSSEAPGTGGTTGTRGPVMDVTGLQDVIPVGPIIVTPTPLVVPSS